MKARTAGAKPDEVPHGAKTADAAIAHLERVLSVADACTIFGQRYWLGRVQQLLAAPDLLPLHRQRLRYLMERLAPPAEPSQTFSGKPTHFT
ncbi:hypothetical protein [Paraburkholderia ferrariae]|jgi:hypothetical protein|uniref:hypothetical protein n=1 Tax=Paraburkholderia ferrariae TaxID=386056 RepID=UPI000484AEF4|nr:hypothetical protein [Paraburkholderia ferrariae]